MITVSILINGQPIYTRSAVNISTEDEIKNKEKNTYLLDDSNTILHYRDKGAVELAIRMLKTIKEVK